MSSNYTAGIPIKKRRFPLIRPPSPTPEEQSSLPVGNESLQKEDSSPYEGSALSNASIPASSSALSNSNKESLHEDMRGNSDAKNVKIVHSNAGCSRVKIEEPRITLHPPSVAGIGSNKKLVPGEKSANTTIISAKTELNLSPCGTPALSIGKDVSSKQKVEERSKSELPETSGITELSLGIKEHLLSGQNGEGSCQNQDRGDPVSLNLSLSKGDGSNQCKSNDFELNTDDANRPTNRSNWDLNTTMDAWDGHMVGGDSGQVAMDGFNTISVTHDITPLISSIRMVGDTVSSGRQIHKENDSRSNGAMQPELSSGCCNSKDNLHLGLSPPFLLSNVNQKASSSSRSNSNQKPSCSSASNINQKLSSSSAPLNASSNLAKSSVPKAFVMTGNLDKVNITTVKSEPLDESIKHDFKGSTATPKELLDSRAVKSELVERGNCKTLKSSTFSTWKLVDPRSIKPEPVHEGIQITPNKIEGTSNHLDKMMLHDQDVKGKATSSVGLSTSGDVSNSFEQSLSNERSHFSGALLQEKSESARLIATDAMSASVSHDGDKLSVSGMVDTAVAASVSHDGDKVSVSGTVHTAVAASVSHDGDKVSVSGMVDTAVAEDKNVDDPEQHGLKFVDVAPPDSTENGEGSASDDEKINLSGDMLEEDSYGTDYESDGNHDLGTAMDSEQDGMGEEDFEDGEVREPLADTTMDEPICEKQELRPFNNGDSDKKQMDFGGLPCDGHPTSSYVENKDGKTEEPSEPNNNDTNLFDETAHNERTDKIADDKDTVLQESTAVEMPTGGAGNCPKGKETEQSSDQAPGASQENSETIVQGSDEDVKNTDVVDNISALPKAAASFNTDNTAKDANSGCQKSRIINLRASNSSSPGKTMTIPTRSLPTRAGRSPDVALEGDKLSSRGRDEFYPDGSRKFSRDRHQDQPSRNSRLNFGRGRGRISSRIDSLRGDWNPERDFVPEFYNGPVDFRVPRHKYGSETDLEFNSYNVGLNGGFAGTGRGRRKPFNDEAPVFRHLHSRRSPGGREGPPGRGHEMLHRIPRNISPSRCIGEDGSELVGLRHSEKFMRGFQNDNSNPLYTHPQASYEGLDGQFVRGNRNFLPMQRRGLPRIRSKSPIGSRRRSPDGFGGHPELPNRRSSPIYRMERMRSPDHSCFPAEMVVRRHGSPYLSRQSDELQDMDSGRNLGHPRPVIPNRSPSGRVLLRNTRRLDIMDPRERAENDDYFGRPLHSGRYHELGADGPSEERRRFSERRGPVRPFRHPYNGDEGQNFHLNAEDGPRPFRFCPENDSEFHDRGNLREREFDRRIKNRPGNAPRRARNIEEQEGNYRHGGHVWHDDGFDDMSRIKRKRF